MAATTIGATLGAGVVVGVDGCHTPDYSGCMTHGDEIEKGQRYADRVAELERQVEVLQREFDTPSAAVAQLQQAVERRTAQRDAARANLQRVEALLARAVTLWDGDSYGRWTWPAL